MAYSKLHSSIVNSSLWVEPDATRLLFITLLAMCDQDGVVYGSRGGLGRLANIDIDDQDEAWESLMSPDPDSSDRMRAPEHEGRRVEEVPGGFRLLNFSYYRGLRNEDDRREQNRQAQAKFRQKSATESNGQPASAVVSHGKPQKAHTEADTEAEAIVPTVLVARGAYQPPNCPFETLLAEYHALCPSMTRVRILTNMRMKHCRARWLEVCNKDKATEEEALDFFRWYFKRAEASDFLSGRHNSGRPWKADFEWLMTQGNWAKVIEGKYSEQ